MREPKRTNAHVEKDFPSEFELGTETNKVPVSFHYKLGGVHVKSEGTFCTILENGKLKIVIETGDPYCDICEYVDQIKDSNGVYYFELMDYEVANNVFLNIKGFYMSNLTGSLKVLYGPFEIRDSNLTIEGTGGWGGTNNGF